MNAVRIIALVLLSILHLLLTGMLLEDLASRKRVLGRRKVPWGVAIACVPLAGALVYVLCHPRIIYGPDDDQE